MNELLLLNSPKDNKNHIELSKGAINFLDNQILKNGENKIIEKHFKFQIIYATKKLSNWYCCSLLDQDSKFGGFCIQYESQYGEPKKGDIIETRKITIVKLPNRNTNLYFCENVQKLNESKKMVIDPKKIDSISKKRDNSRKSLDNNSELLRNLKSSNKNIFNSSHKISSSKKNIMSDIKNKGNIDKKKYTLISNLTSFTNNPILFLKCRFKSVLKVFSSADSKFEGQVQNYIFYDTKGDQIQGVAFREWANKFNDIIKVGSIYEISKVDKKIIKSDFNLTNCQFQLIFRYSTKIEEIEDKGEFGNVNNLNKSEFIQIKNLANKINKYISVIGIILEDKGKIEKRKENGETVQFRILTIGDNSLHKINLKLWEEKMQNEKAFSKGEIICIYFVKFKQYYYIYDLNTISISDIVPCDDKQKEKDLKDFYLKHQNINEYIDMNFVVLNSQKDIKFKFIKDCINDYKLNENNNTNLIKINGTVINIYHKENNCYEGCIYCNKKFEDVCPACLSDKKKLVFSFHIQIIDCSDPLWIEFFGDIGENLFGINPEKYQNLILNNDKNSLNEISKKLLFHNYIFIGKYKSSSFDDKEKSVIFSVIQFCEINNEYNKELIPKLKQIINNI